MMHRGVLVFVFAFFFGGIKAQVQQPDFSFGNIKPEDFAVSKYPVDTSAGAVYLYDIGSTYYHQDDNQHNEEVYQRRVRIRILNKNAFDLATLIIPLYNDDEDEQKLEDLQAATYNLVNGKVVAEPIKKEAVFKEKRKGLKVVKLTLPDVKEGSIIEFAFVIKTPGIGIPGWDFQREYPVLWSEYEVTIPFFYNYSILKQGNLTFIVDSASTYHADYSYRSGGVREDNTLQHEWVMQNVPPLATEPFINTLDNYAARIEFQLSAYQNASGIYVNSNPSWFRIAARILNSSSFAYHSVNDKDELNKEMKEAIGNDSLPDLEKAKRIFTYVRDHYICIDHSTKYLSQVLSKTMQSKQGNVADINLLLLAMLSNSNLTTSPVLLSTTSHGRIVYEYPILSKYNYIICSVLIDRKQYLLDASYKYLPFGRLRNDCYNGYARVVDILHSQGIVLSPNSLNETVTTTASVTNETNRAVVTTSMSAQPSLELKEELIPASLQNEQIKKAKELLLNETTANNIRVDGLSNADSNINVSYELPLDFNNGDEIIYFSPLLSSQIKSNPFAAVDRKYVVELPYCREGIYHLTMDVPKGYDVDELPKPYQLKLNDDDGLFDYAIGKQDNKIEITVKTKLTKAVYEPEEYQLLRNWYAAIIKKEAEQVVFKKIK